MSHVKRVSVVGGCFNEAENLQEFYDRTIKIFQQLPGYDYEIIIADNCSTDGSREILRRIAMQDKKLKLIFNSRNFGQVRSPYNALMHATGDAVVALCVDLQTPPEMIKSFINQWEKGFDVVIAKKVKSRESLFMSLIRKSYYHFLAQILDSNEIVQNFTGFGLYTRKFMEALKKYRDPYPYFRGLVTEIGFTRTVVEFVQENRKRGRTKNNFFTLYDIAMTGFVNHSKVPLRLATLFGFCLAGLCLLVSLGYLIYKLMFWQTFTLGLAPMVIGSFFLFAVQLIFIGIIGEFVGAILTQVKNYPLVIEDEKINFD